MHSSSSPKRGLSSHELVRTEDKHRMVRPYIGEDIEEWEEKQNWN